MLHSKGRQRIARNKKGNFITAIERLNKMFLILRPFVAHQLDTSQGLILLHVRRDARGSVIYNRCSGYHKSIVRFGGF